MNEEINALNEIIESSNKALKEAEYALSQINKRRRVEDIQDSEVVTGKFNGQIVITDDGYEYPVPANYASKSKLVEGDTLKLTITPERQFIYKQIAPVERKRAFGIVVEDEKGNQKVLANGEYYHVLLASLTYFRAETMDQVSIVYSTDPNCKWAAIENVIKRS